MTPTVFRWPLQRVRRALPAAAFARLRDELLASPLVGASTLAGPFQTSRGFAVTFRAAGRATVEARFPSLRPWFEATLGEPGARALTPFWRRRVERVPNAWYLNVLLMNSGASVARHLDVTLRGPSGDDEGAPELVSVLYLKVPRAPGGDLCLWAGPEPVAVVQPRENRAVHFRGDLAHEVRPFDSPDPAELRASLVIEQYHFAPDALERLPDFQLDSRAGFDAFLEAHRSRGAGATPAFELEK